MDKKKIKLYIILLVLLIGASILLPYAVNAVSDAIVGRIINHSETETDYETEEELLTETEDISDSVAETVLEAGDTVVLGVETDSDTNEAGSGETIPDSSETETSDETLNASKSASATDRLSETTATGSDSGSQETTQASSEGKTEEADAAQSERLNEMETYVFSFQPEIVLSAGAEDSYSDFLDGRETQFLKAVGEYVYSIYDDLVSIAEVEIVETVRNNDDECSCQIELITDDGNSELFICSYNKKWDYYGVYSLYSVD
ncbi:MAG: hypothetical protein LUG93_15185 [Lachnospiraceae bacterium]|nr:hypothetical protein [Lachnospiraceae bacterium]